MILKTQQLTTPRLVLRPMVMEDAPALFAILGDSEAMAYWDRPALPRLATVQAQLADELAGMAAGGFWFWTVFQAGNAIGSIDLDHSDGIDAWTGFAFRRDCWGQGLAREALGAAIGQAFGSMGLNHLMARVQAGNARAIALLERLGFQARGGLPAVMREGESRSCLRFVQDISAMAKGR